MVSLSVSYDYDSHGCLEAVVRRCSLKKVFLKISQNSQENTRARVFIKKETLTQVFSREFCEISKSTFFIEHLWWQLLKYF